MSEHNDPIWAGRRPAARSLPSGVERSYIRFAALGDSATCGIGDPSEDVPWRGWARLLADAIGAGHDISFCNLAVPGSTTADVRRDQLADAVRHHPHLASLIVGLNDTMRTTWDPAAVRENLLACAAALAAEHAVLLTVRFHDHCRVLRLPKPLARVMSRRISGLNEVYDEIHQRYGGIRVDLSEIQEVYDREFWAIDRLHPSELGHRNLAHQFAVLLRDRGLCVEPPSLKPTHPVATPLENARWVITQVSPWVGRRTRELGPTITRTALDRIRTWRRP
jgi:lysophospholipase L1-like esterase